MGKSEMDQIKDAFDSSQHILITCAHEASEDAISGALALFLYAQMQKKQCRIVTKADISRVLFLPHAQDILPELMQTKQMILSLDISQTKVEEFTYAVEKNELKIFITPKDGAFNEKDLRVHAGKFSHDLIMVIDTPDLESLGSIYENNTQFFYETTIVNIDHHTDNEKFGELNLVDFPATATCEILWEFFRALQANVTEDIATCLLTGIVTKTDSFRKKCVTPRCFETASKLIALGARRNDIVQHLYQNRPINVLKLWGRALARLQGEEETGMYWSLLSRDDYTRANASSEDTVYIIAELRNTILDGNIFFVFAEGKNNDIIVHAWSRNGAKNILTLFSDYHPVSAKQHIHFAMKGKTLTDAEHDVIASVRREHTMTKQNALHKSSILATSMLP